MTVTVTGQVTARARLFAHPLRVRIVQELLANGKASPSELAERLDEKLPNLSYHMRMLHGQGLLRLATTKPRRGAIEHFYVANGNASNAVKALRAATGELLAATPDDAS
jgi:DNA-binding transcriptional ArsR family regulator